MHCFTPPGPNSPIRENSLNSQHCPKHDEDHNHYQSRRKFRTLHLAQATPITGGTLGGIGEILSGVSSSSSILPTDQLLSLVGPILFDYNIGQDVWKSLGYPCLLIDTGSDRVSLPVVNPETQLPAGVTPVPRGTSKCFDFSDEALTSGKVPNTGSTAVVGACDLVLFKTHCPHPDPNDPKYASDVLSKQSSNALLTGVVNVAGVMKFTNVIKCIATLAAFHQTQAVPTTGGILPISGVNLPLDQLAAILRSPLPFDQLASAADILVDYKINANVWEKLGFPCLVLGTGTGIVSLDPLTQLPVGVDPIPRGDSKCMDLPDDAVTSGTLPNSGTTNVFGACELVLYKEHYCDKVPNEVLFKTSSSGVDWRYCYKQPKVAENFLQGLKRNPLR
ncbi:hypothetical protein HDV00_000630 [Rhizophlyctis rosea]|nr:hypothetical protein HDV00_000630 [Rhizophlyctis rosea]